MDFTANQYIKILQALRQQDYCFLRVKDYLIANRLPPRFVIIRHDVDLDPLVQLFFAKQEAAMGIRTSYYFRHIPSILNHEIITQINCLGHEVGYHYEVITKAKGDQEQALEFFREEVSEFQERWNCQTICPHGGAFNPAFNIYHLGAIIKNAYKFLFKRKGLFSQWNNFEIWRDYQYKDFNLLGDAYASIDFSDFLYLSDTGRRWKKKYKRLDHVNSPVTDQIEIHNSKHLIEIIQSGQYPKLYLLFHLEQWKDNLKDWTGWYLSQLIRRTGKKIIFKNG